MIRLALLLVALGGCDKLFDLDHISGGQVTGDGGMDADAPSDAKPCVPIGHDEDGDGIDDACDACPTIVNSPTDTDGDGLPDLCDRDDSPTGADQILAYWTFGTDQSVDFIVTGSVSYASAGNGSLMFNGAASITTTQPFIPTRIELHVVQNNLPNYTADLQIQVAGGSVCHFRGANCAMTTSGTQGCIMYGPSVSVTWLTTPTAVRRYSLYQAPNTKMTCDIGVGLPAGTTATGAGMFPANTVGVAMSGTGTTRLEALVIYGAK